MQRPKTYTEHRLISQQRRASAELTSGLESQIDRAHQLSAKKRSTELLLFGLIYLIGAICASATGSLGITTIGILIMGIAINSLGILIHEGLHGLLAKDSTINHGLSFLCGLPLLISSTAYQVTHNDHHFELGRKLDYGTYKQHMDKKWMVWSAYLAQLSFGSILYILLIPLLAFKSVNLKARCTILLEYCLIAVFLFLLHKYLTYEELMTYWILPACGMILLTNIRGLASHALGDYDDIYLSSRTIGCNKLTSVLFLHENYHLEHHLFPQVPSYNLKHTHNLIWRRLPRALYAKSYLHFLFGFFNALVSRDLQPMGIVRPQSKFASNNQI